MTYKHLSLEERHYIQISLKDKISHNNIAKALSRSQPSISREIARNKGQKGYRYQQADNMAVSRHKEKEKSIKLTETVRAKIVHYIKEDWSPEQICGWLKKEGEVDLHHETIYRYLLNDKRSGSELYQHLRHHNKTYRKRYGSAHNPLAMKRVMKLKMRIRVNSMDKELSFDYLTVFKKNSGALRLLSSPHFPLLASFFFIAFIKPLQATMARFY